LNSGFTRKDVLVDRRAITVALWTIGILNFGTNLFGAVSGGYDTVPLWHALHGALHGGTVYTRRGAGDFLYPPSALLLLLPLGAVGEHTARQILLLINVAAVLVATVLLLRTFRLRVFGLPGAVALCGVSVTFPIFFTLSAGNVDALVLLGFAGFLLAADRNAWTIGGASLGLSLALKPVLAPLILIVVLYRRWRTALVATAVPLLLSGVVLLVVPSSRTYFSTTVPLLFHGQNAQIQDVSYALKGVGRRLGIPSLVTDLARIAVVVAAVLLVRRRWRSNAVEPSRLVELSTIALAASFLAASFAFPTYGVYILPLGFAAATRNNPLQHWLTWAALFCIGAEHSWYLNRFPNRVNVLIGARFTLGLLLILLSIYLALRRAENQSEADAAIPTALVEPVPTHR
jgi:arabinofuranan 3-O-arabinosyltransferase